MGCAARERRGRDSAPSTGWSTPSFNVHGDKGYFKCFGCGVGGDVIKFVELYDKVAFPEAVRSLAGRFGLTVPEAEDSKEDAEANRDRESLLKAHEVAAAAWFREQLAAPAGAAARRLLTDLRGITAKMIERQEIGYAPPAREALKIAAAEKRLLPRSPRPQQYALSR